MKEIKIVRRNSKNFRIIFDGIEADLKIDENTENFVVGDVIKCHLFEFPQKRFRGQLPKYRRFRFSNEKTEIVEKVEREIQGYAKVNLDDWRFELHIMPFMKNACIKNKMIWNPEKTCWETAYKTTFTKVLMKLLKNYNVIDDDEKSKNLTEYLRIEEESEIREKESEHLMVKDLDINLSDDDLNYVLEQIKSDKKLLRGKWWDAKPGEIKKYEVCNGGRFGTDYKVAKEGYIKQFQSLEYITRVCHAYDCKSVKDLLSKV